LGLEFVTRCVASATHDHGFESPDFIRKTPTPNPGLTWILSSHQNLFRPITMLDINDTVPPSVAIEMRVVPIREIGGKLVLATDGKVGIETRDRIVFILNRDVRFVLRSRDWIDAALDTHYGYRNEPADNDFEIGNISWYWPSWHSRNGETLAVKCSGWNGTTHWSGAHEFPPEHPDREFWEWLISIPQYCNGLLDDREIPKIRRVWNRYRQRTTLATNKPMDRSGGSAAS